MAQGLAVDAYKKLAEMAIKIDSVKFKTQAISSHFYLVQYYNDIKKDKASAINHLDQVLAIDPTNADAIRIKEILNRPPARQPATKPKTGSGSKPSASPK